MSVYVLSCLVFPNQTYFLGSVNYMVKHYTMKIVCVCVCGGGGITPCILSSVVGDGDGQVYALATLLPGERTSVATG